VAKVSIESFDHLVGAPKVGRWHLEAERLGRLEVNHQRVGRNKRSALRRRQRRRDWPSSFRFSATRRPEFPCDCAGEFEALGDFSEA
jgi:hypothetical protein